MPRRHRLAGDLTGALRLPEFNGFKQALHHAAIAPQHQHVAGDFSAPRGLLAATGAVMLQVDPRAGAVVLAHGVDGLRHLKAALILGQRSGLEVVQPAGPPATQFGMQVGQGVAIDHVFGQRRGLDQVEPVVVRAGKVKIGGGVHVQRGGNIDHAQALYPGGVVHRQAVCNAAAPVMTAYRESANAQAVHHLRHVLRQRAFAVIAVVAQARDFG